MRKWMRERLQRRKKKTVEQAEQPAPPPLQPAYFEEATGTAAHPDEPPAKVPVRREVESVEVSDEGSLEAETVGEEHPVSAESPSAESSGRG